MGNQVAEEKLDKIMDTVNNLPGYIFEFTANLGSERTLSIRGNFEKGVTKKQIDVELDMLVSAADRKLSQACIPNLENEIEILKGQLVTTQKQNTAFEKKAERWKTLPETAVTERDNISTNIAALTEKIKQKEKFLAKVREDAK